MKQIAQDTVVKEQLMTQAADHPTTQESISTQVTPHASIRSIQQADSSTVSYLITLSMHSEHSSFHDLMPEISASASDLADIPEDLTEQSLALIGNTGQNSWLGQLWLSESSSRMLIAYSSAEASLTSSMMNGGSLSESIADWMRQSDAILKFHRHNRQRCTLIDAEQALGQPQAFLESYSRHLRLSDSPTPDVRDSGDVQINDQESETAQAGIYRLIARHIILHNPGLGSLQAELEASSLAMPETNADDLGPEAILSDYQRSQARLCKLEQDYETLHGQYQHSQQQLGELQQIYQQEQQQHLDSQKETHELTEENSLLLTELKRFQDEQEQQQEHLQQLQEQLQVLQTEKEQLVASLGQREQQGKQQEKEAAELKKQFADTQKANEQLSKDKAQLDKQLADTQKTSEQLSKDKAQLDKQLAEIQKQQQDSKSLEEENELLLLQLHQVQEELETTFLNAQANAKQLSEIRSQLQEQNSVLSEQRLLLTELRAKKAELIDIRKQLSKENVQLRQQLEANVTAEERQLFEQQLSEAREQNSTLSDAMNALQEQLAESNQQDELIAEQRLLLTELRAKKAELADIRKELGRENVQLRQQLEANVTAEERQQLEQDKQALEQQLSEVTEQNRLLAESLEGLQQHIADLQNHQTSAAPTAGSTELQQLWEEFNSQQQILAQQQELISEQRQLLTELRAKKAELIDIRKQLSKENVQLRQQLGIQLPTDERAKPSNSEPDSSPELGSAADDFPLGEYQSLIEASPLFDADFYLSSYPDVAESGINPALHYLLFGAQEQRDPSPQFSTTAYLQEHPELVESGINPLIHYIQQRQGIQQETG